MADWSKWAMAATSPAWQKAALQIRLGLTSAFLCWPKDLKIKSISIWNGTPQVAKQGDHFMFLLTPLDTSRICSSSVSHPQPHIWQEQTGDGQCMCLTKWQINAYKLNSSKAPDIINFVQQQLLVPVYLFIHPCMYLYTLIQIWVLCVFNLL